MPKRVIENPVLSTRYAALHAEFKPGGKSQVSSGTFPAGVHRRVESNEGGGWAAEAGDPAILKIAPLEPIFHVTPRHWQPDFRRVEVAQGIQLYMQYDPRPLFGCGTPETAPAELVAAARLAMADVIARREATAARIGAGFIPLPDLADRTPEVPS